MSSELKVAILGAGRMAREHIRAFSGLPGVTLAGIFSRSRERAQALATEFGIPQVCDSIQDLHTRTRAGLAVVTVSAEATCEVAEECCRYSWDLLLEKPPGYDVPQAKKISEAAQSAKGKVFVALNRRFLSSTVAAATDLAQRSGPRHILVLDQLDQALTATYGHPQEILDRMMFFSSIHLIDYLRAFGRGSVTSVQPLFPAQAENGWITGAAIEFESGDTGIYQAVWNAPGPWAVAIHTKEVRWDLRPLERASFQLAGERKTNEVPLSEADQAFKPGFRLQAEQTVRAVRGEASTIPSLSDAVETMLLIEKIHQARSGRLR